MSPKARLILCAAVLAYLAGDLFLFHGPLDRAIQTFNPDSPRSIEKALKKGLVARVYEHSISTSQLDRATYERLWLEGKSLDHLPPEEQQEARKAALDELIEHELLRQEIALIPTKFPVTDAEINDRLTRLLARFETKGHLETAMKSQGIPSEKALRDRIAARIVEQKFIESKIAPLAAVTDDEARKWFDTHQKELETPERLEARHVFIATLETPADQAKQKLDTALVALTAKQKDFPTLAKELSEDPATKDNGGNLGWMTRSRLAPDFAEPVSSLPIGQPTLIRTKLGWHLIEVTARKPAEPRPFEDAKPEILAALEAIKRREAIQKFRENLRAASASEIRIFQ